MKTTQINALFIGLVILFTSCNSEKKNNATTDANQPIESTSDNSMNALDWEGTYEGELPCADCEGIKTIVTLNQDNTYVSKEVYLGKDTAPMEKKGTFKWDETGQKISFSDIDKHPYFVGENTLTQLDENGDRISGDLEALYILKKVNDQLVGKKWHLVSFKGEEIQLKEAKAEHPYIEFNDDFTLTGYTACNNLQGVYTVEDAQKIKFSQMVNTLKTCGEMETENEFLKTINATAAFGFQEHALIMYDKEHQPLALFKAAN